VNGTWLDNYGIIWYLTQNGASVSGTAYVGTSCTSAFWSVSGSYDDGDLDIAAVNPWWSDTCALYFYYNGSIHAPGCNTGNGTWENEYYSGDPWFWAKPCDNPNSETSVPHGWNGPTAKYGGTITGAAHPLGGRTVTEQDPGGGNDQCWFLGSIMSPFESITGGTWPVANDNTYGDDWIGWSTADITYYRAQGRAPCETYIPQRMEIACAAGPHAYKNNSLYLLIDLDTLEVWRDGVNQYRGYP
jgi:hypothetical protein